MPWKMLARCTPSGTRLLPLVRVRVRVRVRVKVRVRFRVRMRVRGSQP